MIEKLPANLQVNWRCFFVGLKTDIVCLDLVNQMNFIISLPLQPRRNLAHCNTDLVSD